MSDGPVNVPGSIVVPGTILLVDDDAMVRLSVAAFLEDSGYKVEQVADGASALAAFQHNPPSLIITDLKMPRMDGLALLRAVAASPQPVPVIVMSGAGSMQDVVEALRYGAADYLVKPIVDFRVLEHAIDKCLERVRLVEQNRCYREQLEKTNREMAEYLRELEQDQQAGRQLQLKLFPQQDLTAGPYHFSHCIIPSLYLSGDFLEYVKFGEDFLGFYIADVSGHGVSSAFVTALLRHFSLNVYRETREAAIRGDASPFPTPADVLSYYNRELLAAGIDKHVTMFMAVLDRQSNTLAYSVAGHLPMPILATDEGVQYLGGNGMPVGILHEARYQNYSVQLPARFTLVLCSDGVLEVIPAKGLIEKEAMLLELVAASDRTQRGIEQQLNMDAVGDAPDDIAIMTLVKTA
ncbi:MAG: SpoIIE family protein phosphatase [Pseudomonadales bacterium]|jgi:sigma-B regulation protein RsbU (phosphoserine phosphatase)|nr:SpoIIE family protein phosphatase [Cellvibrionales bacterium]MBP8030307.1 SpoIIE family protein phosphatase [Pseudomonadales bacterium]